jgi:hypothetical protein
MTADNHARMPDDFDRRLAAIDHQLAHLQTLLRQLGQMHEAYLARTLEMFAQRVDLIDERLRAVEGERANDVLRH